MSVVIDLGELARHVADLLEERMEKRADQHARLVANLVIDRVKQQADADIIGTVELAAIFGSNTDAVLARLSRDPELRALAIAGGGKTRWRWRRGEVLDLLARRRVARQRPSVQAPLA